MERDELKQNPKTTQQVYLNSKLKTKIKPINYIVWSYVGRYFSDHPIYYPAFY